MKVKITQVAFIILILLLCIVGCNQKPVETHPTLIAKGKLTQFGGGMSSYTIGIDNVVYTMPDNIWIRVYIVDTQGKVHLNNYGVRIGNEYYLYRIFTGGSLLSEKEITTFNFDAFNNVE